jgi:hypothetical protein
MSEVPHDPNTAAEEPKNPWAFLESPPKEEPKRDPDVLRVKDVSKPWLAGFILKKGCLTLLIIFGTLVGCSIFLDSMYHRDADRIRARAHGCRFQLRQISIGLDYLTHPDRIPEKLRGKIEPVEITPDMTIADLIREALRQDILDGGPGGKYLCCTRTGEPYLVFPVPASVVLQEPEPHKHIPIVMDPPHAHDESKSLTFVCRLFYGGSAKYISAVRVLYADGGIETISNEDAEKLVAEHAPVPFQLDPEPETKEKSDE